MCVYIYIYIYIVAWRDPSASGVVEDPPMPQHLLQGHALVGLLRVVYALIHNMSLYDISIMYVYSSMLSLDNNNNDNADNYNNAQQW